ncbi:hypothetical protein DGG96_07285 [Legionella qingyii]|uniref:Uncharacterized protein n=1 Tax=Legionella qingyii TaxID=2184757 RepID=A0A317U4G2_9GAMM|nr:hypothetical protein DGG96_07285 [Legionella qingyii]
MSVRFKITIFLYEQSISHFPKDGMLFHSTSIVEKKNKEQPIRLHSQGVRSEREILIFYNKENQTMLG